jgi:hypothetical protein
VQHKETWTFIAQANPAVGTDVLMIIRQMSKRSGIGKPFQ